MRLRRSRSNARLRRTRRETSRRRSRQNAVRQLVFGRFEEPDCIVDVGVGGEDILPAVVVEIVDIPMLQPLRLWLSGPIPLE